MRKRLFFLAISLLLVIAAQAQVNFKKHDYFFPVAYPEKLVTGDFNNDGLTDVIASGEYTISVLLNSATGSPILTGYRGAFAFMANITSGDFDGDHDLDLASVVYDNLYILLNSGTGMFTVSPTTYPVGSVIGSLTSADFNKDGLDDIAITSSFLSDLSIYFSTATGLAGPSHYAVGTSVAVQHSDLNQDGHEDLVVASIEQSSFSVLTNKGDGTFGDAEVYSTPQYPSSVVVTDVDGDEKTDIMIGAWGDTPSISVYKSSGNTFSLLATYPVDVEYITSGFFTAGDIDQNDTPDLIFLDWTNGTMNIMRNDGSANFGAPAVHAIGGQPRFVLTEDFNSDGKKDISVANYSSIQIAYNQGGGGSFVTTAFGAGYPTSIAQSDFNGDGSADVATTNFNSQTVSIMLNDRHGRFLQQTNVPVGNQPVALQAGDVTGDEIIDLVTANVEDDSISILPGVGDGTFSEAQHYFVGNAPLDLVLADFNADGKTDIAVANNGSSTLSLLLNTGAGFQPPVMIAGLLEPWHIKAGDLNGDDLPDLVVIWGRNNRLSMILNTGNGTFGSLQSLIVNQEVKAAVVANLTSDNIPDIGYTEDGYFKILKNEGQGTFIYQSGFLVSSEPGHISMGDFTGDGKQDVAVASISSSTVSVLIAKEEEGGYYDAFHIPYTGYVLSMAAANFDGDDKDDLALGGWPFNYLSILVSLPRLTVTVLDSTRQYGRPEPEFKSVVEGWPGPEDLAVTYSTDATIRSSVGEYAVWPVVSDSVSQNFAVIKLPGTLTITPAPLTIIANDTTRAVKEDDPYFTARMVGLLNGDSFPFSLYTTASTYSPPGKYPIIPYVYSGNPNYDATLINGTLTVTTAAGVDVTMLRPYPNPGNGGFFVDSGESAPLKYTIVDMNGRALKEGMINFGTNPIQLEAPPGLYLLKFESGNVEKVAIE